MGWVNFFFSFVKMNFLPSCMRFLDSKWKVAKKVIQVDFLLFSKLFEVINKKCLFCIQCFGFIDSHGSFCFPKLIFQRNSNHLKTFKEIHSRFLGQSSHFLLKIYKSILSKLHIYSRWFLGLSWVGRRCHFSLIIIFFSSLYVPLLSFPFNASKNTHTRTQSEGRREAKFSV